MPDQDGELETAMTPDSGVITGVGTNRGCIA